MFGLKLKSWMEAHLGRPRHKSTTHQNQKRAPKEAGSATVASSCSSGSASTSSTTNSTSSCSGSSTTTAIVLAGATANNPTSRSITNSSGIFSEVLLSAEVDQKAKEKNSNFGSRSPVTTSSPRGESPSPGRLQSESTSPAQQQPGDGYKVRVEGDVPEVKHQNGDTHQQRGSELGGHAKEKSGSGGEQQQNLIPAAVNHPERTTSGVIPSVSNSTSILSGSSFSNSLSSPDTGYSTDGYSPKSVYPELSFDSSGSKSVASSSKSSYTISSLVSSELHSSKQASLSSTASCSVQNGLDEYAPPSPALVSSTPFSSSSGISSGGASDSHSFPKGGGGETGLRLIQQSKQHSIPEDDDTEKTQVIMEAASGKVLEKTSSVPQSQQQQQQKTPSKTDISIDPLSKFGGISIDLKSHDGMSSGGGVTRQRTHRRAESMDARTPSQEDYKPLVDDEEEEGGNLSQSMTAGGKNIRTSFMLNTSGQIVEFSTYKNAFSICSPRRERTRIKTNPWIIVNNNRGGGNTNIDTNSNANGGGGCEKKESGVVIPPLESAKVETISRNDGTCASSSSITAGGSDPPSSMGKANLEINNRHEVAAVVDVEELEDLEDETGLMDHDSSSSLLYRISTSASASDSGKGTLEPGTNRNSTESSCLLSDSTASTRNSIISHEAERTSSGRSSSGEESISSSVHHTDHHPAADDEPVGHASASPDTPLLFSEHQKTQHIHQSATTGSSSISSCVKTPGVGGVGVGGVVGGEERTFKNAAVATDRLESPRVFPKSASVSVGVGTTSSNRSAKIIHHQQGPVMVDKETDILSDWGNTDEDGDEDMETDRNDNDTVTPAPSSPQSDVDRGLFSQSTSSATDIDFGDSSAATAASSTAVFPPSSLIRHSQRYNNVSNNSNSGNGRHNESGGGFNGGGDVSEIVPGGYDHHHRSHNINMNLASTSVQQQPVPGCYPSVPIIRPVLAAAQQLQHHHALNGIPDSYSYDIGGPAVLVNHAELGTHFGSPEALCFTSGGGVGVPNFNLAGEPDYPEMRELSSSSSHHHKGIARGALGFLRKIFKKGACSSQRHSPDGNPKGKKSRGKSDNNLASVGLGSPLLTISEPLSNPRYSAVLTTKKQMNPALNGYFFTPTPNSFRRRSGGGGNFTDSSDSKGSKQQPKSVKTDIIRLPQGPLSPHQQQSLMHQHQLTSTSSHSSGGSSCSGVSNGIPPPCSAFLHAPTSTNLHHLPGASQSNTNTNSTSTSSSIHSLMSTSTSASANNMTGRPPSSQQKTPVPGGTSSRDNYYSNSSPTLRHSNNPRGSHSMSPPPLISENSPYLNGSKNPFQSQSSSSQIQHLQRRDPHSQSPSMKGLPAYPEPSPRLPNTSTAHARMNSPSFNNYSPIHRLVVTGGSHLLTRGNPNCPNGNPSVNPGLVHYSNNESPLTSRNHYNPINNPTNNGNGSGTGNNSSGVGWSDGTNFQNRPPHPTSSPSPLINHRYSTTSSPHPYPVHQPNHHIPPSSSSAGHFFASPSPILRNPRYQYITSSNQNSPILNASKRINIPLAPSNGPSGPTPLLTTFSPLPSSSSSSVTAGQQQHPHPRESLINNNSFPVINNANTISATCNLNSGQDGFNQRASRQVVSTSVSYNEFENLSKNYHLLQQQNNGSGGGGGSTQFPLSHHHQQHHVQPQQQQHLVHQQKSKIHQNHYYSSPIVKDAVEAHHVKQSLWNNNGAQLFNNSRGLMSSKEERVRQRINQNLRFNSFLVRHRQLPQFYHTQWGLQERIYETVDSEDEQSRSDEMSGGGVGEYDQDGNEMECSSELSLPVEVHHRGGMKHYARDHNEGEDRDFYRNANVEKNNVMRYSAGGAGEEVTNEESEAFRSKSKRSKPKSLSASGKPLPRPVVALPMMPGTYLSETETRLLEADKESDRKYKRLINEAEALLKEISVEKKKRAGVGSSQEKCFRLEDCPQSDPLRRKAYDCWALRRLQQELAGCCASPPVLHRSRLNLQSPSTPTVSNNPYLSHFQNMSAPPPLPQQVPYLSTSAGVDNNQNSFEF